MSKEIKIKPWVCQNCGKMHERGELHYAGGWCSAHDFYFVLCDGGCRNSFWVDEAGIVKSNITKQVNNITWLEECHLLERCDGCIHYGYWGEPCRLSGEPTHKYGYCKDFNPKDQQEGV